MNGKHYDTDALKRIPILHVATRLGVWLVKTGGGTWQQKDGDGLSSLTVFEKTNTFVRFSGKEKGGVSKGSVIDFVMHIKDDPDFKNACAFLADLL